MSCKLKKETNYSLRSIIIDAALVQLCTKAASIIMNRTEYLFFFLTCSKMWELIYTHKTSSSYEVLQCWSCVSKLGYHDVNLLPLV